MRTAVATVVVVAIILLAGAALIFPAVQAAREGERRMQCGNNVKQLCLGLQNYHDTFLSFPPGARSRFAPKEFGTERWGPSWLVPCVPYFGINQGYDGILKADAADLENDYVSPLMRQRGNEFAKHMKFVLCPSSPLPQTQLFQGQSLILPSYAGVMGATDEAGDPANLVRDHSQRIINGPFGGYAAGNGMLLLNQVTSMQGCSDGTANVMLVGEVSDWYFTDKGQMRIPALSAGDAGDGYRNAAGWLAGTAADDVIEPRTRTFSPATAPILPDTVCNLITIQHSVGSNNKLGRKDGSPNWGLKGVGRCGLNNPLLSAHPAGAMVGFVDGHVELLTKATPVFILKRLAVRDDGAKIPDY